MNAAKEPDPRVFRTQTAVRDAVRELFEEGGTSALTHQRVAQRAGVGRATIYRHWPEPADLLSEALQNVEEPLLRLGPGPFRTWLRREMTRLADDLGEPAGVQWIAATITGADGDPRIAALRDDLMHRTVLALTAMLDRYGETGPENRPDPEFLLTQLVGPLIVQTTILRRRVNRRFIDQIIDSALAGADNTPSRTGERRKA